MKTHKPDLNERITIRMGTSLKRMIADLCKANDLDEAMVARMAMEAGLQLARENGITSIMETRAKLVAAKPVKAPVRASADISIRKGEDGKWFALDASGTLIKTGPLYDLKAWARKQAGAVEVVHLDGKKEILS